MTAKMIDSAIISKKHLFNADLVQEDDPGPDLVTQIGVCMVAPATGHVQNRQASKHVRGSNSIRAPAKVASRFMRYCLHSQDTHASNAFKRCSNYLVILYDRTRILRHWFDSVQKPCALVSG